MEAPQAEKEGAKKDENNGIYIVIENNQKQPKDNYRIPIIKVLSSLHLMVGAISFLIGSYKLILKNGYQRNEAPFHTYTEGIFCGIVFMVTGLIGFLSLRKTTYCKISAFLVLSIFSCMFGFIMAVTTLGLMHRAVYKDFAPAIAAHYMLLAAGLMELLLGVLSASFSCSACCGCCGGVARPEAGDNSVVYIPSGASTEGDKPRVVHLNMAEIQSRPGSERNEGFEGVEDSQEDASKAGKYSRFN